MHTPLGKRFLWPLLVLLGTACMDMQGPVLDNSNAGDILAEVRIRSSAIMIAKGDSLQVGFDLIAMNGDTILSRPENITWTSNETQTVPVTATGVIYGRAISDGPINITVAYVHKYVTKFDTVSVYVTDGRIDANAIRLISLDSNRIGATAITGRPRIRVDLYKNNVLVQQGALIPLQIEKPVISILDRFGGPNLEPIYRIQNDKGRIGKFWIRSSLNLYGNEVNDSLNMIGLYSTLVNPGITVTIPSSPPQTPILESIPLFINQLCGVHMIINLSAEPMDILYSDSTASSTGCAVGNPEDYRGFGLPFYGVFIGGNVLNVTPGSLAIRKSNTPGIIQYSVRKSATSEPLPWLVGHMKQIDVDD